ncbi:probable serine/threonine-protein kinase PBL7 [Papaver somniferum]|nr:probable serine/threonine-protein kinase PBL7 [Papaver somniferum]
MIGYCDEGKDHMIVCEFMPLRSLNLHLHDIKPGKKPLDWKSRMKIAEGVARALKYLHHGMDPLIISNCLEVSKILLNENYNPKLSDFGCAEIAIPVDHCRVRTKPAVGYVSPEYTTTRNITSKSDVYCFGVVLLELISGQKAFDATRNGERDIVAWARPMLRDSNKFPEIADPLMERQYPYSELV